MFQRSIAILEEFTWQKPVIDKDLNTPPVSPTKGDRYIVGTDPTGDWSGHAGDITLYTNSGWVFITKQAGMYLYVIDEAKLYKYISSWSEFVSADNLDNYATKASLETAQTNIMLNAFRLATLGSLTLLNMVDSIVDEFEDESGVDTDNSINEVYNSSNDYYTPDYASGEETNLITCVNNTSTTSLGNNGGKEYRQAQKIVLTEARAFTSVEVQFSKKIGSPSGDVTCRIETDSSGPSNTLANANATKNLNPTDSAWNKFTFDTSFILPAGTYWITLRCSNQSTNNYWVIYYSTQGTYASGNAYISTNGGTTWSDNLYDMTFKLNGYVPQKANMTLLSNSFTAENQPDSARIILFEENVDSITLNTDIKAYVSRDDGSSWEEAVLTDEGFIDSTKHILSATLDISEQSEDTDMRWEIKTFNNKDLKIHGVGLSWA